MADHERDRPRYERDDADYQRDLGADEGHADRRTDEDAIDREDDRHDAGGQFLDEGGYDTDHEREDPHNSLLGEGTIVLLVGAGLLLFFFPEPSTSALGAVLIVLGVAAWLAKAIR